MVSPESLDIANAPSAEGFQEGQNVGEHVNAPEHLARLIFLSYRFSQGGIGTQNRMLLHIEDRYHPDMFTGESLPEIKRRTTDMVSAFFLNEKTHPATAVPWEDEFPGEFVKTTALVTNELAGLFDRFSTRDQLNTFEYDPVSIAMSIITMDADYLQRTGGRAGNDTNLKVKVSQPYQRDAYDSMFIRYAVLGASTHTKEYDDIFRAVGAHETIQQLDDISLQQLLGVIDIYQEFHPESLADERVLELKRLCEELNHGE